MGAQAIRIQQLWDMLEETDLDDTGIRTEIHGDVQVPLRLELLSVFTPKGGLPLVEGVSLQVSQGGSI